MLTQEDRASLASISRIFLRYWLPIAWAAFLIPFVLVHFFGKTDLSELGIALIINLGILVLIYSPLKDLCEHKDTLIPLTTYFVSENSCKTDAINCLYGAIAATLIFLGASIARMIVLIWAG